MSIATTLEGVLDWFTPDHLRSDPLELGRVRTVIGSGILAACVVPIFSIHYFKLHHTAMGWGILAAGAAMVTSSFVLKFTGMLRLAQEFLILSFMGMVNWMCYVNGGIESSSVPWFLLIPVAATFIGGRAAGVFWSICGVVSIVLFFLAHEHGWALPKSPIPPELHAQLMTRSLIGLSVVLLGMAWLFETGKTTSLARIEQARSEAEASEMAVQHLLEEITRVADTVAGESAQISQRTHAIHETMHHQAQQARHMSSEIEALSALGKQSAGLSEAAAAGALSAGREADASGTAMATMRAELSQAATEISRSAERIEDLGRRSDEIAHIVQVIREIAEQTNLLALNAAIEAAHAGTIGRGFAVVAEEVRKLAERTAKATTEIEDKIGAILTGTASAVEAMRDGTNRMQEAETGAEATSQRLARLIQETRDAAERIASVASTGASQSSRFAQIEAAMQSLSQDVEEASGAAGIIAEAVGTLDTSVQKLDQQVHLAHR